MAIGGERVTALGSYRKIPVFRPQVDAVEPWLILGGAAKLLGITLETLRLTAEAGEIEGAHPLPDGPWNFSRSKLATLQARQILDRAGRTRDTPQDRLQIREAYSLQPLERWASGNRIVVLDLFVDIPELFQCPEWVRCVYSRASGLEEG